jgi:diguanylate cyclase (GGDEF)-like protein
MSRIDVTRLPQVLFGIGKAIGSDDDLPTQLSVISELVTQLVGADAVSIMLLDPSGVTLLGKAAHGLRRRDITAVSFRVGDGVAGWVARHGEPALIPDVRLDPRFKYLPDSRTNIVSLLCVPLIYRDEPIGVVTATAVEPSAFGESERDLLIFVAKTMAMDVENIRLRKLSVTDPLTGAFNREYLHQQLPRLIDQAESRSQALSVAMVDVDHFKAINDQFGHDVGDEVLAHVAHRLRGAIRDDDTLVRFGGEEFLVLLPRAGATTAVDVAERMRRKMASSPVAIEELPVPVRISVGVAEHRIGQPELVKRADIALYAAKRAGRDRVEVAP